MAFHVIVADANPRQVGSVKLLIDPKKENGSVSRPHKVHTCNFRPMSQLFFSSRSASDSLPDGWDMHPALSTGVCHFATDSYVCWHLLSARGVVFSKGFADGTAVAFLLCGAQGDCMSPKDTAPTHSQHPVRQIKRGWGCLILGPRGGLMAVTC